MAVELGDKVKDSVSGFEGVAVARHTYLQGCNRISVQPVIDKEGKLLESQAFDEPQLIVLKQKKIKVKKETKKNKPGGPMPYKDKGKAIPMGR